MNLINTPPLKDLELKWSRLQQEMRERGIDACIICSNANLYYLTGNIFSGYFYIGTSGDPICFLRRETSLRTEIPQCMIRKPEDIPGILKQKNMPEPKHLMLEGDMLTYNEFDRLQHIFNLKANTNASNILRFLRMIKTDWEIGELRRSTRIHTEVYQMIPSCYQSGMSDIDFQTNIETLARKHGSIGIFRGFGSNMEIHMGSVLSGDNAGAPSPYDFALGGKGLHPSAPIGADGTILRTGTTVMVDIAGNYTAYISDMTRTYAIGNIPEKAHHAHLVSKNIQQEVIKISKPGTSCSEIYELSLQMAAEAGLATYFMGTKFQAKFVGHGLGLEINEPPVLTGRSKDVLQKNMTFALEPKFVLPEIGAVGIENTFLVTADGLEQLTVFEEDIITLN